MQIRTKQISDISQYLQEQYGAGRIIISQRTIDDETLETEIFAIENNDINNVDITIKAKSTNNSFYLFYSTNVSYAYINNNITYNTHSDKLFSNIIENISDVVLIYFENGQLKVDITGIDGLTIDWDIIVRSNG